MILPERQLEAEQERIRDLFTLIPAAGARALDAGTRDGFLSGLLAERFESVVALDLELAEIHHPRITAVAGNICKLDFPDNSFDLVLCSEVLEHIPPKLLVAAGSELARVSSKWIVIGVPFRQDLRRGCTTCAACGATNPPWGHVNSFTEAAVDQLFRGCMRASISYVGSHYCRTNAVTAGLLELAGNPYGTYHQLEKCVYCDAEMIGPANPSIGSRVLTKIALNLQRVQDSLLSPQPKWMHIAYCK